MTTLRQQWRMFIRKDSKHLFLAQECYAVAAVSDCDACQSCFTLREVRVFFIAMETVPLHNTTTIQIRTSVLTDSKTNTRIRKWYIRIRKLLIAWHTCIVSDPGMTGRQITQNKRNLFPTVLTPYLTGRILLSCPDKFFTTFYTYFVSSPSKAQKIQY